MENRKSYQIEKKRDNTRFLLQEGRAHIEIESIYKRRNQRDVIDRNDTCTLDGE